ncbi:MAG: insulinase family protein, partial [Gammaproteobacteria bacterium]|nr:insulinase family protein [Gammaproteobacteria bacterium]
MFNKLMRLSTTCLIVFVSCMSNSFAADTDIMQLVPISTDKPGPVLPIQHWVTKNGANVYFVPEHQLPILDIEILFNAGSAQDGNDDGVANFTSTMIGQGAQNLTADEIADRFDSLGAIFATNCSRDAAQVSLRTLITPGVVEPALQLFTQVLTQPNFAEKSFGRVKNQLLQSVMQEQQTPSDLADNAFYAAVYGNYPYAHPPLGSADSIKRLTPNSLISFYRKFYVGANTTIAIVGDIDQAQALKIAKQIVGGLPKGTAVPTLSLPIYQPTEKNIAINYPSTQTYIRIGQLGISRTDPNYFPLYVGNYVLG